MKAQSGDGRHSTRKELPVAGFLVAFGGAVILLAGQIWPGVPTDPLGPRAFPIALGAGILLCGLLLGAAVLLFRGLPERTGAFIESGPQEEEAGPFSPVRLVGAVIATGAYIAAFEPIGYLLATPVYVLAIALIHGATPRRARLVAPLLTTVALYVAFRFGLRIPVPEGLLEMLLPWGPGR